MGESRTLWEIGLEGCEVRSLRSRLGLDSGYASRVLRSLERQRLVRLTPSAGDQRVRLIRLTERGVTERIELDRRADEVAHSFLDPLTDRQRVRLVDAMAEVDRLLTASSVAIDVEDPSTSDARWCIEQYFGELDTRFDVGFDSSRSISATAEELTYPAGLFLMARLRGNPVGCGALKFHADSPTELKRMWVAREIRGLGVGRRLLAELERRAAEEGARVIRLETNRSLTEAIDLYRKSGYQEVARFNNEPYADHWFEKVL
ncbi:MAG TPA: bifunctional helix-turn-helix transcriptional regulator/GNAT family N-acetyltransferase [Candidatus Dormibacteraeota bacterium]|nr:bifunctional helix-turn-helix transcriptional regulator/GNAT family N-acetyltransferase [Candidatus Dormibacteraeota bacterium]